jgi:lincosamide nucleotidyltransferase B/F
MQNHLLLNRLDEIGQSLERTHHALALIGLGSVGLELERIDAYSDLDFFVIVEPGYKKYYLDELQWLSSIHPVAYYFPNTVDGYKLLFADGIFCEFAVFEPDELDTIPFSPGRIVWKQAHVSETIGQPIKKTSPRQKQDQEWLLGEALTNLYVGMARERRGERLSAMRFIQMYAVDHLLELAAYIEVGEPAFRDEFAPERRFEQRYPSLTGHAPVWMQGYERNRESALEILSFLRKHFEINTTMDEAIQRLCR